MVNEGVKEKRSGMADSYKKTTTLSLPSTVHPCAPSPLIFRVCVYEGGG